MNEYRMRMARSIANRLGSMVMGPNTLYGIGHAHRMEGERMLLDMSGGRRVVVGNMPAIELEDGRTITDDRDRDEAWRSVAPALDRWMDGGAVPPELATALPVASGAAAIARHLDMDIGRLTALSYLLWSVTMEKDGRTLGLRTNRGRASVLYRNGALRWDDGVVTTRSKPLPQSLRMALRGRRMTELVDDPALGEGVIALVVDADTREQLLRVHTTDKNVYI